MSHYTPEMDRNGIAWSSPVGTWKQNYDISHLAEFADRLIVSADKQDLNSSGNAPTPWARLLLFEAALFDEKNPAHQEAVNQWRGLLGLLALAAPLGLDVNPSAQDMTLDLRDYQADNRIVKTFLAFRPSHLSVESESERGKWDRFHLIVVDGRVLGATSPRTLVFTGVSHVCPPSIPFQSSRGRLSDPARYYKKFKDTYYLSLVQHWLHEFIATIESSTDLFHWLGSSSSTNGTEIKSRHSVVMKLLQDWRDEVDATLGDFLPLTRIGKMRTLFSLAPYSTLKFLPSVPEQSEYQSDLLLDKATAEKIVIGFNPQQGSILLNAQGYPAQNEPLNICGGRWMFANETLAHHLHFLPQGWRCIEDPRKEFFEDSLIEVKLPPDHEGVHALIFNKKAFLFPFKPSLLKYFTTEEIYQNTEITIERDVGFKVSLKIPLVNERSILVSRLYLMEEGEIVLNEKTAELAVWPDFASDNWHHYFYFKGRTAEKEIDFEPLSEEIARQSGPYFWYFATKPVQAFVGTIKDNRGLLLLKYKQFEKPTKHWKVAVDLGSTHTRAFSLLVEKNNDFSKPYVAVEGETIKPIEFSVHARELTLCDEAVLKSNFFALEGKLDPPTRAELKTLLMQPAASNSTAIDWRPREGYVYMHWIHQGYDDTRLKYEIKWENTNDRQTLRAYLRCLMVMIQAEAAKQGAQVAMVCRSYPSSFSTPLIADHDSEWTNLGIAMKLHVERAAISEAVATSRYLECEEGAPTTLNTISLDIGGSTTDIAIWTGKETIRDGKFVTTPTLAIQESVKLAAGILGHYLQSSKARPFLEWLEGKIREGGGERFSMSVCAEKPFGYGLMFYNLLSYFELGGDDRQRQFASLLGQIKTAAEARLLLAHLIFLYSSLLYYAGVLARKAGLLENGQHIYYLYACGKGGRLIGWIYRFEVLAQRMFTAGLLGPDGKSRDDIKVVVKLSSRPKEEVGRGLLAESALEGKRIDEGFGLMDTKPPSVTVAETGYEGFEWNSEVTLDALKNAIERMPTFAELRELKNFLSMIREAFKNQDPDNPVLDFVRLQPATYVTRLSERIERNCQEKIIEPLFITEVKTLLETLTDNPTLFG
jgi:hypothetical protein